MTTECWNHENRFPRRSDFFIGKRVLENGRLGLLWERRITNFDSSFPNPNDLEQVYAGQFFKEIEE